MEKVDNMDFQWVGPNAMDSEVISRPSTTYWHDAMKRLSKNKAAMVCLGIIIIICLIHTNIFPLFSK